jgi:hypothetical protein
MLLNKFKKNQKQAVVISQTIIPFIFSTGLTFYRFVLEYIAGLIGTHSSDEQKYPSPLRVSNLLKNGFASDMN